MPKLHSREELYRFMWDRIDYRSRLNMSQGELAKEFGISYQRLSVAMSEFIGMGMVMKHGHEFTLLYHPDKIPWDTKFKDLRKRYLKNQRQLEDS